MQYFENNELEALVNYSGIEAKGVPPKDLEDLFSKLHDIVKKAIDGLHLHKEKQDKRDLKQSAGRNHGFKYKEYLWVKIYDDSYRNDDRVFFNITIKKDGNLTLCIDFLRKNSLLTEQFNSNTRAQEIYTNSIAQLDLNEDSNNEETKIKGFILEYIKNHLQTLNDFRMLFNIQHYKTLLSNNYNLIFTGAPGTGKTYLAREIAAEMIGCNKDDLNDRDQFGFVQFHPSYDYTDFVEGLRPMLSGGFQRTDGTFKAFCAKAAIAETKDAEKVKKQEIKEEDKRKYVFVIDEINRGEISKIFGELFFSIDPGYRKPEDRVRVKTQYQNLIRKGEKIKDDAGNDTADDYLFTEGFYVPSNVYIIGTMNDIDRSVESMDFAFRRRFAFYEILAKDRQEDILSKLSNKDEAIKKMTNLNAAIEKQEGFGPSYHIGPAYFKQIEKYNGDWEQLWKNHLYGVLFEYLRGVPDYKTILNEWKVEFDK